MVDMDIVLEAKRPSVMHNFFFCLLFIFLFVILQVIDR